MPRQNDAGELVRRLTAITMYKEQTGTHGSTTTNAAIARGAVSVNVVAITNFTAADPIGVIGDGGYELILAGGTPATTPYPWSNQKLEFAQSSGASFIEYVAVPLGKIEAGGFSLTLNKPSTAIESAQDTAAIAFEDGTLEMGGSFGLLGFNTENIALIVGVTEQTQGVGTSADPYSSSIGGPHEVLAANLFLKIDFLRFDGKTGSYILCNAKISASGGVQIGKSGNRAYTANVTFGQLVKRYQT